LTGNELEGPRGRIYLLKAVLENEDVTATSLDHLDHCLGCRACETTCPSGVQFHRLADIGREMLHERALRPAWDRQRRRWMARFFDSSLALRFLLKTGRVMRRWLPGKLSRLLPEQVTAEPATVGRPEGRVLLHEGCVQPALAPGINAAAARVLARRRIACDRADGCCGALAYHLDDVERARDQVRRNIDAWHESAVASDGLVVTASGCAAFIRDYAGLCRGDTAYEARARELADRVRDLSGLIEPVKTSPADGAAGPRVVLHLPCTLRHAIKGDRALIDLLTSSGWDLLETRDDGECCGSAGAYSLLHPKTAGALREKKLGQLAHPDAEEIVTANIGCRMHLAAEAPVPVRHWIELWDELESRSGTAVGHQAASGSR
jgi:glycolate oxidase iron-sulfur subunit